MGKDSSTSIAADLAADAVDSATDQLGDDETLAAIATAAAEVDEERVHAGVPAEMGLRVLTRLIDWMIVAVLIVVAVITHQLLPRSTQPTVEPWLFGTVLTVIVAIRLAELTPGGSPGKRFSGIRLLTGEGYTPLFGRRACRLLLRSGGTLVISIGLAFQALSTPDWAELAMKVVGFAGLFQVCITVLDWLWLATTGLALHDVITRTVVGDIGTKLQRKRGFEMLGR